MDVGIRVDVVIGFNVGIEVDVGIGIAVSIDYKVKKSMSRNDISKI